MARLKRVNPDRDPGCTRVRRGSGFSYLRPSGARVSPRERARIEALVIPPAWRDVWICANPRGHIQAVGTDEMGRRQYLYHPAWAERRGRGKYARALRLAEALPAARAKVTAALSGDGIGRERVLAAAFRLLDRAAPRVGSTRALAGRGVTTLLRGDATVEGDRVTLSFPGKGGKWQRLVIDDAALAEVIGELARGEPRRRLFAFRRGRRRVPLRPRDVNAYITETAGSEFSAKDFRTLRGTTVAARALADAKRGFDGRRPSRRKLAAAERDAVRAAAGALGNTPAVARDAYIDPRVFARFRRGRVVEDGVSDETALRRLLS
ncbi:DNA topoisomerase [Pseudoclavibacter endophyticus]|uniref:DNA topoisomerase IB n=1 Tax=Pseudoclavibacter endophyticus TaxID=1778590 RepID=A0A6H9WK71_9MICO|nr:DNA topoisomerase IB [Pseudoclavibacter endophyticus]KAB1649266.1 DNA topoisomerase IB [Pseudoclavibacter endophyticus]GGA63993.1 DNA topoisomerase [Pseudoclavibacter endophyticus]